MTTTPIFDCTKCGACCAVYEAVEVRPGDTTPLELLRPVEEVLEPEEATEGATHVMRTSIGRRCIALKGEVGGCNGCGIYRRRPRTCREYTAGSQACRQARMIMRENLRHDPKRPEYQPR